MKWRFAEGKNPRKFDPSQDPQYAPEITWGRVWKLLSAENQVRLVSVVATGPVADADEVSTASRKALDTDGRSAIEPYLDHDELPRRLQIEAAEIVIRT
jgi:hypothetical protein